MAKIALLIGVSDYEPGLTPLPGATKDVEAMQRVLHNPDIGGFAEVQTLLNPEPLAMQEAIETLFSSRNKDDLVLLFFSGHGVKNESGKLYFATRITRKNSKGELLKATAVPASFVHDIMSNSRSKRQVVILDCCFSGAFAEGLSAKDDGSIDVKTQLGGEGRVVLTSSTSTQYSFEQQGSDLSIYTRYLVEGIETGAADRDRDGLVSVDELHEYASSKVQEAAPAMKPKIYAVEEGYRIRLAQARIGDPKLVYRQEVEHRTSRGEISILGRRILDDLRTNLGLLPEDAAVIEAEVLKPYRNYQQKLQRYEQAFTEAIGRENPISTYTHDELKRYQDILGLRDEDVAPIETRINPPKQPIQSSSKAQTVSSREDLAPVKAASATSLLENPSSPNTSFVPAKRDFRLLIGAAIVTPVALISYFLLTSSPQKPNNNVSPTPIASVTSPSATPINAETFYRWGLKKYNKEDYKGAIADFSEAIRLNPNFADAYVQRGDAHNELNQFEAAKNDYNQAIKINPSLATAYFGRGHLLSEQGNNQAALADYNQAIQLDPNDADFYYYRGLTRSGLADQQGAIADYSQAIGLNPDFANAYNHRGNARFALKDYQRAIADYTQAIGINPNFAGAYFGRAKAQAKSGYKQQAIADYQKAANLYLQQGNTAESTKVGYELKKLQ